MKSKIVGCILAASLVAGSILGCGQTEEENAIISTETVEMETTILSTENVMSTEIDIISETEPREAETDTETASETEESEAASEEYEVSQEFTPHVFSYEDFDLGVAENTPAGYSNMAGLYMDGYSVFNYNWMVGYNPELSDESEEISLTWETHRGIGLGDTKEDVIAAYGEVPYVSKGLSDWNYGEHIATEWFGYVVELPNGVGLQIEFMTDQNDIIIAIIMEGIAKQYMSKVSEVDELIYE